MILYAIRRKFPPHDLVCLKGCNGPFVYWKIEDAERFLANWCTVTKDDGGHYVSQKHKYEIVKVEYSVTDVIKDGADIVTPWGNLRRGK